MYVVVQSTLLLAATSTASESLWSSVEKISGGGEEPDLTLFFGVVSSTCTWILGIPTMSAEDGSDPPPQYPPGYDPRTVESTANIKYDLGDLDGAQMAYQQALLDWVDHAREATDADAAGMGQAVADLWIAFANLNRKANKHKAATDAYEAAVNCEIAGRNGKAWLEYAQFQEERKRHKTAQKIYLRALVGDESSGGKPGADERYHSMLWNEFLRMMRELNNAPNLSLEELRDAVEKEHVAQMKQAGGQDNAGAATADDDGGVPPLKRAKIEDTLMQQPVPVDVPVMSAESIEKETAAAIETMQQLSPDISAAWFARDGDSPPSRPEPPLFTPSPPKFSDATGRNILGDELALKLIQMLLKKDESDESGSILLDICRGCWMMTALKEKETAKAVETLDTKMNRDLQALEATLESRASVAGDAALAAVQMINEAERTNFLAGCNQIRQQLIDGHAWQFRELFAVQQQILTKANLPGFDGPSVDASSIALQANVCAFMHSAFFLRTRIGEKQHLAMLTSQEKRLTEAVKSAPSLPPPSQGIAPPIQPFQQPPPGYNMPGQYQQQQQSPHFGYQMPQQTFPGQPVPQQMYHMPPPQGLQPPPGPNPY